MRVVRSTTRQVPEESQIASPYSIPTGEHPAVVNAEPDWQRGLSTQMLREALRAALGSPRARRAGSFFLVAELVDRFASEV